MVGHNTIDNILGSFVFSLSVVLAGGKVNDVIRIGNVFSVYLGGRNRRT